MPLHIECGGRCRRPRSTRLEQTDAPEKAIKANGWCGPPQAQRLAATHEGSKRRVTGGAVAARLKPPTSQGRTEPMLHSGGFLLLLLPLEVPLHGAADALVEVHLGRKAQLPGRHRLVGACERNVAHLVGHLVDVGLLANMLLNGRNQLVQGVRGAATQIHDQPRVLPVDCGYHAAHNVVNVRELSHSRPITVLVNRLVVVDGVDKLEGCHVRPPTWSIDSEEAEHRDVQLVEMVEGVAKELAAALGGSVRADGGVTPLVLAEWRGRVLSVDAAAGGSHDVLDAEVPAVLEDVDGADNVRRDVAVKVLDGIAHSRLGCQVAHDVRLLFLENPCKDVLVADVKHVHEKLPASGLLCRLAEDVEAAKLDLVVVVAVEVVDGDHVITAQKQLLRRVASHESSSAGDEDALLPCNLGHGN
mmetsp:Transcript_70481/g.187348  ORF Transcript_70481/g.187348 Transcript_70481/m.187348 type:complete len:416 (+) Transcript_70481:75-1322(+)